MAVSRDTLQTVARLARLSLTNEELDVYERQLSAVLDAMEQLNAVPTAQVPAADLAAVSASGVRDDRPQPRSEADAILQNAPERSGRYLKLSGGMFNRDT